MGSPTLINWGNDAIKKKTFLLQFCTEERVWNPTQISPQLSPPSSLSGEITPHQSMFRHPSSERKESSDVETLAGAARLPGRRHWAAIFRWAEPNRMSMPCEKTLSTTRARPFWRDSIKQPVGEIVESGAGARVVGEIALMKGEKQKWKRER